MNDTWFFDTSSNIWVEIDCVGDIPSPRSAHAAAVLHGIMYIFGGQAYGMEEVYGDLYAFYPEGRFYMVCF
jgi:hypothetical protein